jgi:hypothetical protein
MKLTIQLVAVLVTAASASLAMACGCSSEKVRLEPVREKIIMHSACAVQQPIISNRTTYVPECPSCVWIPPSTSNPAYVIGNVLTAPFRLITGRSLGQPDIVSSYNYTEPVGERVTTLTTHSKAYLTKCGCMTKKVTIRSDSMLEPVGERLTTVKVIRTKPLLQQPQPVCERVILHAAPVCSQPMNSCDW